MTTRVTDDRIQELRKERAAEFAGYRRAADLMEAHPEVPAPGVLPSGELRWWFYEWQADAAVKHIADIRRAVGGTWTKREAGSKMYFERDGYTISVDREVVCTRRVVGTKTVTLPAVEAQPERTVERDIVEWDCQPLLAPVAAVEATCRACHGRGTRLHGWAVCPGPCRDCDGTGKVAAVEAAS